MDKDMDRMKIKNKILETKRILNQIMSDDIFFESVIKVANACIDSIKNGKS
jgi:hypothetical protein